MVQALAIIPARGGSKGLPRKNLASLGGRTLLARAVDAARAARLVSRVVVSTDDDDIAAAAQSAGAEVVRRPEALASDTASSEAALLHALEVLDDSSELIAFLQCTAPFLSASHIDGTLATVRERGADCGFAALPFAHFLWRTDADGLASPLGHPLVARARRQDEEPRLLEAGSVYVMRREGFLRARHRFFGRVVAHVVSGPHVEIDDAEDLALAQALYERAGAARLATALPRRVRALVLDFDGVLTDGSVELSPGGEERVLVHRRDGHGVSALVKAGVTVLVLSAERHRVVQERCEKLGVPCLSGVSDKAARLQAWLAEQNLAAEDVVYVGDDENDLPCFGLVGCSLAPSDAHPRARAAADVVLSAGGGRGAVREVSDAILQQREDT